MNYFIPRAILAIAAPRAIIACARSRWNHIVSELQQRSDGRRESGCFLLGTNYRGVRFIEDAIYYDDLDPDCAAGGGIDFDGSHFAALWDICRSRSTSVIADIHTHPGLPQQSSIDARNPAISTPGHIALILPSFGDAPDLEDIGLYVYQGRYKWTHLPGLAVRHNLAIAWWL